MDKREVIMKDDSFRDVEKKSWRQSLFEKIEDNFASIFMFLSILLVFLICLYRIFATRNYSLKYTYYIAFISLYMMIFGFIFKSAVKQFEERKNEGKKFNSLYIGFASIVTIVSFSLSLFSLMSVNFTSPRHLNIGDLHLPDKIFMSKIGEGDFFPSTGIYFIDPDSNSIRIDAPEDIEKIVADLESKELENLAIIDSFNFIRMKWDNTNLHALVFDHKDYYMDDGGLDQGYVWNITMTSNGKIVIEDRSYGNADSLFSYERISYYPVDFSRETMDLIDSYAKKLK